MGGVIGLWDMHRDVNGLIPVWVYGGSESITGLVSWF